VKHFAQGAAALALTLGIIGVACCQRQEPAPARPATWAVPIDHPPLANLHQITPMLYRGAQPTSEGFAELEKMGIRTVVNLRGMHGDSELLERTGLAYRHITFQTWHPEDEDIIEFLRIVTKPENQPVFFHCHHGSDRTGTMCAIYRLVVQGWSKDDAIREMTEGNYGFHIVWDNLITYLRDLDVDRIRSAAGL
jgi:protein tyrosine/serine phosphatase